MVNRRIILSFPPEVVQEPATYFLVKDYDLKINILKARILPREGGRLVMEVSGLKERLEAGLAYLASLGIEVKPLIREVKVDPDKCVHCTACLPMCPTGALSQDPDSLEVVFNADKCVVCESCVKACPYRAVEIFF